MKSKAFPSVVKPSVASLDGIVADQRQTGAKASETVSLSISHATSTTVEKAGTGDRSSGAAGGRELDRQDSWYRQGIFYLLRTAIWYFLILLSIAVWESPRALAHFLMLGYRSKAASIRFFSNPATWSFSGDSL